MFSDLLNFLDINKVCNDSTSRTLIDVKTALVSEQPGMYDMAALLSPVAKDNLELLAEKSHEITVRRFGKTIQLYTPIYLSNYCSNNCLYCGFRRYSSIKRKMQSPEQVEKEALYLKHKGFKNILLVAGDDPKVDFIYLEDIINRLRKLIPSISLEIAPRTKDEYKCLNNTGVDGIVNYQETYEIETYNKFHKTGSKADYNTRLDIPERAAGAGIHRVGIGILLGLGDPVYDALALYAHARYLLKYSWKTQLTISLPRLRKAADTATPSCHVDDSTLAQLVCAFRIALPDVGIMLSTREYPKLRDGLIRIGVTHISAGSKTEVGGYLVPDKDNSQFSVEDKRSPEEIQDKLIEIGYDPVWKDWEMTLNDKSTVSANP